MSTRGRSKGAFTFMSTRGSSKSAFTLVELLVVIAIIGVLVALLLPAIQSARESGRRAQCMNNVKQVALGLINFHDAYGALPMNTETAGYSSTAVDASWMTGILPFIEDKALVAQSNFSLPVGVQPNLTIAQTVIPTFRCPSDMSFPNGRLRTEDVTSACWPDNEWWMSIGGAITNYKACAGANWGWGDFVVSQSPDTTNYDGLDHGNGIIFRNWDGPLPPRNFKNVTDGLSHTFAVGEAVAAWCAWNNWRWSNGCTATCAVPLNYKVGITDMAADWCDFANTYSFHSMHPAGGNFAMCDGGVHFVSASIDINVYRGLATIASGEMVQVDGN
jgi:prepilin-type N-terminal cleavage/methylation domain-containing protein